MIIDRRSFLAGTAMGVLALNFPARAAAGSGGIIDVAMIGEPPTLDPMMSTADLVGTITQHIFETLFTFDGEWKTVPMLAAEMPAISDGGKAYDVKLREGVKFHDGSPMTSADVVASLQRWLAVAGRGKQAAAYVSGVEANGDNAIKITMKEPWAPLLALLAFNNSAAVVLPKGKLAEPLTEFVGTGPYKLVEHKPDQYIQLARFEDYAAREEAASGYGGKREPIFDEIRFVPVPDPNTRVAGVVSGQYVFADLLPTEAYGQLDGASGVKPLILEPFGNPSIVMNMKAGILSNKKMRHAVQAALDPNDMMLAAFGDEKFFKVDGALYPENYVWHTEGGVERYGAADAEKAAALMKEAGYDGSPIRILTSRQYEFHYKIAQVMVAYLQAAGFKTDMQVSDWATLTTRRQDPSLWDIFITHGPFVPEPALIGSMSDSYPGWWVSDEKQKAVSAFNAEPDPDKRVALFPEVQRVFYDDAPLYKVGNFNALSAASASLENLTVVPWPFFWNTSRKG
ncbi:ABC transporter substrate-binding protein [Consotaella salsifontis]|uniref:Peptide/nickel transport system substrate-binding protein n=1 Tax=Consotaella salsifontis TaxID=1365950 RepID=A0A1T4PQ57_9HYPH|nr:ABC transporter substrate-binding protein [Consotaella salsifontis]SJZ93367.1 peptide/nickel transport system substrate-binding protein [Consotaella salsifontis]